MEMKFDELNWIELNLEHDVIESEFGQARDATTQWRNIERVWASPWRNDPVT